MLSNIPLSNILFLDIETVPQQPDFGNASLVMQQLWEKKAKQIIRDDVETPETIYRQAGIYAEFGKIICVSCGFFAADRKFRIKSFAGDDEKVLLEEFSDTLK